jgi:uncharacterized glyoxalase superfamily protein PhnB
MTNHAQNVFPAVRYEHTAPALEWLRRAFGFEDVEITAGEDGTIVHAELSVGGGVVMFGSGGDAPPSVYVALDEVDAHYEQARAAGAEILRELTDTHYGSREYSARDPEGHVWHFGTYRPG